MSPKTLIYLLAVVVLVHADDQCQCSEDQIKDDVKEFREFLLGLPLEKARDNPVLPGELSPFVCTCIDKDRKKRGTLPWSIIKHRKFFKRGSLRGSSRHKCAFGYSRVGGVCVPSNKRFFKR